MRLILASSNSGKLRELAQLLRGLPFELVNQDVLGIEPVEETGSSFEENARLKARHAAVQSGGAAVADDSGLEVDALNGAPGIFSARYAALAGSAAGSGAARVSPPGAGMAGVDKANNARLIDDLRTIPPERRQARYRCVLVFMRGPDDSTPIIAQGEWAGMIVDRPRGDHGFGYDPYFLLPELGLTAAQLDAETKNRLSHRGQAMRALRRALERMP